MKHAWFRLLILALILGIPLYLALQIIPDVLWFSSLGYRAVWARVLTWQTAVFAVFFFTAFAALWGNVRIARAVSDPTDWVTAAPPRSVVAQLIVGLLSNFSQTRAASSLRFFNVLTWSIIVGGSLILANAALHQWDTIAKCLYQVPFGQTDPLFHLDIGFYVFTLPLLRFLYYWLLALLIVTLVLTSLTYAYRRILIYIVWPHQRVVGLKVHLMLLFAAVFAIWAFGTWLNIFGLLFNPNSVLFGANYVDVHATQLGYYLVTGLLLFLAILCVIVAISQVSVMRVVYLFLLTLIVYVVAVRIYPSIVQSYVVDPNELAKERPYIEHNIRFTRYGFNLQSVQEIEFPAKTDLTYQDIRNNQVTLDNARLWDEGPLKQTFSQLQEIRLYYEFPSIDVDRYVVDGNLRQVMLSVRELNTSRLSDQAQTWLNRHLVYTHGYGVCMSPVNEVTPEGLPKFYIKDLPPVSAIDQVITRPEIYFGEKSKDYAIVNTREEEFDYPKGNNNVYTQYSGRGGILIDRAYKRLLFALKLHDINLLISPQITRNSRLLMNRTVSGMLQTIAPFLSYDSDPYLVITDQGRLVWMVDAYTTSKTYPYAEPDTDGVNYIRNSIKATVDAYNGTVRLYVADPDDPIIRTYRRLFPRLFRPIDDMPASVKSHMRYPRDLFTRQVSVYCTYHMRDPQVFYNREDVWALPQETTDKGQQTMSAYYIVSRLPRDLHESFMLMMPFTPTDKNNMIAWMSANCDGNDYGKLTVFKFPKEKTVFGPMQIESRIDQDTEISQHFTLWSQVGSRVIRGNLMVIPIEDSLIYVEPIYLQSVQSKLPELKRVVFAYKDQVVMEDTLNQAIARVFRGTPVPVTQPADHRQPESEMIWDMIATEFRRLKQSAKTASWIAFGESILQIETLLNQWEGDR